MALADDVRETATILAGYSVDSVVKAGSELSFERVRLQVEQLLILIRRLVKAPFTLVPDQQLQSIQQTLNEIKGHFDGFTNFSAAQNYGVPNVQHRDNLENGFRNNVGAWFERLLPLTSYAVITELDSETERRRFEGLISDIQLKMQNALQDAEQHNQQLSQILEAAKLSSGIIGVGKNAEYFGREASAFSLQATLWLAATVLSALVLGATIYRLFASVPIAKLDPGVAIEIGVARLAVLSLVYYLLFLFGRSYYAARHNATINRRKQVSLSTFRSFAEAAEDPSTKDMILRKTTESIFFVEPSGYLAKEPEAKAGSMSILEILRGENPHGH